MRVKRAPLRSLGRVALAAAVAAALVPGSATAASASAAVPTMGPIMAPSVLTAGELASWFRSETSATPKLAPGTSLRDLTGLFISEGRTEGVRGDLAFIQSVHETGFFQYGGQVKPEHNNYAGIGAVDGGNDPDIFASPRDGVRAQIHHLRAYADAAMVAYQGNPQPPPSILANPPVKPVNRDRARFTMFGSDRYGSAPTWERLTGSWASDPLYGQKLAALYERAMRHAGKPIFDPVPVVGDWNGNGVQTPGWYRDGVWYLRNSHSAGPPHIIQRFGRPGWSPVVGDWNGDGRDTLGVVSQRRWFITNSFKSQPDRQFEFGRPGWTPVAGDWNANGRDTPAMVAQTRWFIKNSLTGGPHDRRLDFGRPGWRPVAGDWTGDGRDTPGVVAQRTWFLKYTLSGGQPDAKFEYGRAGWTPVGGDWNGNGRAGIGSVAKETWYLRHNANALGPVHLRYDYTGS